MPSVDPMESKNYNEHRAESKGRVLETGDTLSARLGISVGWLAYARGLDAFSSEREYNQFRLFKAFVNYIKDLQRLV